jgi:predicted short-subunit dehydrogenase-like oxidoreductase (DUF2520 family)
VDPIGIVGNGRVAQTLGRLLSENGRPVAAIAGRNPGRTALAALFIGGRATPVTIEELPALSSHVLIAVSDRGVEPVAEILAKSGFRCGVALHTCGAKGPQALAVLENQGVSCGALHPIQSFASAEQGVASVVGSSFGIDGNPEALRWASSIVALMGGRSLRISPQHRGLYHAAAVMASSYIAALIYAAVTILAAAGVERSTALMALAPAGENIWRKLSRFGTGRGFDGPHRERRQRHSPGPSRGSAKSS